MFRLKDAVHKATSARSQHLVFLGHVWLLSPFLYMWARPEVELTARGDVDIANVRPMVGFLLAYLIGRTWLAFKDPAWLKWQYVFPVVDVALIATVLAISHRGPLSNVTLLLFLPLVQAAGGLNVRWALFIGFLCVFALGISTWQGGPQPIGIREGPHQGTLELLQSDPPNVIFRFYFFVILSNLIAYQALIGAEITSALTVQQDRSRLALEIHDGVQGSLIALAAQLELIRHLAERDPARTAEVADDARLAARQAAEELRFLVQRMRASGYGAGFVPALRQYASNLADRYGWQLEFEVDGHERRVPSEVEQAIFRISQEALTNVAKHAVDARHIQFRLVFEPTTLGVIVEDNGHGFDPTNVPPGVGLTGMRERAEGLNGRFSIQSDSEKGTRVAAVVSSIALSPRRLSMSLAAWRRIRFAWRFLTRTPKAPLP